MRPTVIARSFGQPPWPWLFALAALGVALSASNAGHASLPAFCGGGTAWLLFAADAPNAIKLLFFLNPPGRLLVDWLLMLLAMMPPLLAVPLMHIWRSSLPRRRIRGLISFSLGYAVAWTLAGVVLVILALLLQFVAGRASIAAALLLAVTWSASPWHQLALNRSHRLSRIGIFGWSADRDCLAFGAAHGAWCIASCWAWMLVPLVVGQWHVHVMVLAAAVMLGERLRPPGEPRWRLPTPVAAIRRLVRPTKTRKSAWHG